MKDTQRALSKYAYYEVIESGRIVMKKGDRPLRFHIIVSGIGHEHIFAHTKKNGWSQFGYGFIFSSGGSKSD